MKHWDVMGGRKFTCVVLAMISATLLAFYGKISGGDYQWVMVAIVGAYITGNVWQARQQPGGDANRPGP